MYNRFKSRIKWCRAVQFAQRHLTSLNLQLSWEIYSKIKILTLKDINELRQMSTQTAATQASPALYSWPLFWINSVTHLNAKMPFPNAEFRSTLYNNSARVKLIKSWILLWHQTLQFQHNAKNTHVYREKKTKNKLYLNCEETQRDQDVILMYLISHFSSTYALGESLR